MLSGLYDKLSPGTVTIIAVALMLVFGFLATRITKLLKLPDVTAYILAGILIGPFCMDLIPKHVVESTDFLPEIALCFIAFSTGEFFKLDTLKKNGAKVVVITLLESLLASVLVFVLTCFVLRLSFPFCIVLSALASATAPASTMMTIRQTGAKGDFVNTLLQVVALDDIVALVAYSVSISLATTALMGQAFDFVSFIVPLASNIGVFVIGGLFGALMALIMKNRLSTDNRLIISLSVLFAFCALCGAVGVSPLLGCMSMGTVYINMSGDGQLFKQLNYFSPPILLLFFVRSGCSFDLNALVRPSGSMGSVPLIVIGVLYFIVRIGGKYIGAFLGCLFVKKDKKVRNNLGLALIPQAGVAIGLAAMGARILGGDAGNALNTTILASSILYELAGPGCAKLALYLSGSYSNKLEDITEVETTKADGKAKNDVEILIDRINDIQKKLPQRNINYEEQAFSDAAEEMYQSLNEIQKKKFRRNIR